MTIRHFFGVQRIGSKPNECVEATGLITLFWVYGVSLQIKWCITKSLSWVSMKQGHHILFQYCEFILNPNSIQLKFLAWIADPIQPDNHSLVHRRYETIGDHFH